MKRTRAIIRHERIKHINRKKRIIHGLNDYWSFKFSGQLNKGKIHCSCWMCSGKTAMHGWKPRDLRELERCKYEIEHLD